MHMICNNTQDVALRSQSVVEKNGVDTAKSLKATSFYVEHTKQIVDKQMRKPTNSFQRLPRVFGIDVIDLSLQFQDLLSLDGDICSLTLDTQHI